ncbi:glucosylceramidase [Chitinophagaceae bacterium IBVUCB2]|nr:glucosylceramidase [Chitinophagaceae bacterium IBVUCB2]
MISKIFLLAILFTFSGYNSGCQKKSGGSSNTSVEPPPPPPVSEVDYWVTKGDQSSLLQKQIAPLVFGTTANAHPVIDVDSTVAYQQIDGFGYTLTGGSADLINALPPSTRQSLLQELFSAGNNGIGVNYLRVSIGASDLSAQVFSYNDLPAGQTDVNLTNFSLSHDETNLIPVLKEILLINPNIKILGSPWSPPTWMKDNNSSIGGSLLPQYYSVYANYFVKYIQAMQAKGIRMDAITIQNEPLHGGNNPSMLMTAAQQATFVKNNLGPAFQAANISTKIIVWDHNCDNPGYPLEVLNDAAAKQYVDGAAFHLYNGDISALSQVHNAYPDKHVYFTEQYTSSTGGFGGDLKWHLKNVIIGSMRNWSRNALEWNLANDATYGPHTPGGCDVCKGALTISGSVITRNVAYYIIAHASKFVPDGSTRIKSEIYGNIQNVAFKRQDGKKVLIVLNDGSSVQTFNIKYKGKWVTTALDAGAVATYVW